MMTGYILLYQLVLQKACKILAFGIHSSLLVQDKASLQGHIALGIGMGKVCHQFLLNNH